VRPRLRVINLISKYMKGKILDAGCADGRNTAGFRNVIGIDIDKNQLEIAKKKGLRCYQMNLEKRLRFKNEEFDTIVCAHVLEHLRSPFETVQEFKRILKKNGTLIIALPNSDSICWYSSPKHLYFFNHKTAKEFIERCGLRIIDYYVNYPLRFRTIGKLFRKLPFIKTHWTDMWFITRKN
jgi:2-polyprenyl-3-methyl-5-hydroxy-6-metoxy-1,4-benzoquinol methylase